MNLSEETLMAYVDGELEGLSREQVELAIATDPEVARRVAAHQGLRRKLRAGFDPVLKEPLPAHLVSLVRRKPVPRRTWVQWSSLAASFALGALAWHFAARRYSPGPISQSHGEFVASGALVHALDGQLVADQGPSAPVQIGVSFRSRQGSYCRTFRLRDTAGAAGLACHENGGWTVQVLVHEVATEAQGAYRQAGSDLPPAVLRAVNDSISGDPLDSSAEAAARARGWRATR